MPTPASRSRTPRVRSAAQKKLIAAVAKKYDADLKASGGLKNTLRLRPPMAGLIAKLEQKYRLNTSALFTALLLGARSGGLTAAAVASAASRLKPWTWAAPKAGMPARKIAASRDQDLLAAGGRRVTIRLEAPAAAKAAYFQSKLEGLRGRLLEAMVLAARESGTLDALLSKAGAHPARSRKAKSLGRG